MIRKKKGCIAIKDGYMRSGHEYQVQQRGRQFAKMGEKYLYYENWNGKFMVDTYKDNSFNHSMGEKFFYEYFQPVDCDFLIEDEDLMI